MMPEGMCDRAMDLAFLLDGSEALSEDEFQATKDFILRVIERYRMGSAHTRATVLLYHSGVKTYDLQVKNKEKKKDDSSGKTLAGKLSSSLSPFYLFRFRSGCLRRVLKSCITLVETQPSWTRLSSIW